MGPRTLAVPILADLARLVVSPLRALAAARLPTLAVARTSSTAVNLATSANAAATPAPAAPNLVALVKTASFSKASLFVSLGLDSKN